MAGPGFFSDFGQYLEDYDLAHPKSYFEYAADKQNTTVDQQLGINPQQNGTFGEKSYRAPEQAAQARGSMQTAQTFDPAQYQQTRGQMQGLEALLQNQAAGRGPSVAATMANQQGDQLAAQGRGLLANQRGTNPGLAGYLAAQQAGQAGQQAAGNATLGRVQEQLGAQQNLGALLGNLQQGDLAYGQTQQQNNQFNAGAYNALLGGDMAAQNQFALGQNQQIGGVEQQRQNKNLDLRNQAFMALLNGVGGALQGQGGSMVGGAGASGGGGMGAAALLA